MVGESSSSTTPLLILPNLSSLLLLPLLLLLLLLNLPFLPSPFFFSFFSSSFSSFFSFFSSSFSSSFCYVYFRLELIDDTIAQFAETGDILRWHDFVNLSLTNDPGTPPLSSPYPPPSPPPPMVVYRIAKKAKKLDKKILAVSRYRIFIFSKGTFGSYSVLLLPSSSSSSLSSSVVVVFHFEDGFSLAGEGFSSPFLRRDWWQC